LQCKAFFVKTERIVIFDEKAPKKPQKIRRSFAFYKRTRFFGKSPCQTEKTVLQYQG